MTKFQFLKNIFIFCFLCSQTNLLGSKKENNKAAKNELTLKIDHFSIAQESIKYFVNQHPLVSTGIMSGIATAILYPEYVNGISSKINEYRGILLATILAGCAISYVKKEFCNNNINTTESITDTNTEEEETSENAYTLFAKSGAKIYQPSKIKTTFDDVAGLESAKEDLGDILHFLHDSKKFIEIGAHVPKGVLLSGPPGNGKTLLARALAGEAQCPFIYISASHLMESFTGIGAARIRHMFMIAKELAPCIVFIDEIDAIGRKRSSTCSSSDTEMAQTLNQLLSEMDGFEQQENPIIIIGATNRAEILDEALIRPGRFDRRVEITHPYIKDRCEILKIYFDKIKTADDINIEKIACGTPGFSGADLAHLVNEAAILAIRSGKSEVTMHEVDQARDFILMGRETKGMNASEQDLWETAIHESGHALASVYQKDATPLYKVTITARGRALGITHTMNIKEYYSKHENELRADIVMLLAGSVAEEIILNHRGVGACSDLFYARKLATAMVMHYGMTEEFKDVSFEEFIEYQIQLPDTIATKLHEEIAKIINECRNKAIEIITEHQDELLKLSKMLMDQKTVNGADVYKLCGIDEPKIQFSLNN